MPVVKQESKQTEKELVSWTAPARPFKRRTRQFYVTLFAIAGLMALLLIFMSEFLPILLIISLVFLYYVMSTVEPENVSYIITSKGIKIAEQRIDWINLGRFWFTKRFDTDLLVVEAANLTGRIELVLGANLKDSVKSVLEEYLVYEDVPPSIIDKASALVSQRLSSNK